MLLRHAGRHRAIGCIRYMGLRPRAPSHRQAGASCFCGLTASSFYTPAATTPGLWLGFQGSSPSEEDAHRLWSEVHVQRDPGGPERIRCRVAGWGQDGLPRETQAHSAQAGRSPGPW